MATQASEKIKLWVWIDPTRRCNLKCELCYTKKSHSNSDLSPASFRTILNKLKFSSQIDLQVLHLNWRGEPLMNPHLSELLKITGEMMESTPMHWHTNGTLMSKKRAKEIVRASKPHKIYFSIDGGSRVSHELNRGPGTFNSALKGLKNLLDANQEEQKLSIGIYQLDLKEDTSAYDKEFLRLTDRVDEWVRVNPLTPPGDETLFIRRSQTKGGDPLVREWETTHTNHFPEGPCFWAGNSLCIAPNGDASVCLLSHSHQGTVGNLIEEPIELLIERARNFREALSKQGRSNIPHCKGCLKPCGEAHRQPVNPPVVNREDYSSKINFASGIFTQ